MLLLYYKTAFAVSFLLTLIYVAIWDRRFDVNITAIFMLVPITNLGHVFMAAAQTQQEAATAVKVIYIGACFMPFFVTNRKSGMVFSFAESAVSMYSACSPSSSPASTPDRSWPRSFGLHSGSFPTETG